VEVQGLAPDTSDYWYTNNLNLGGGITNTNQGGWTALSASSFGGQTQPAFSVIGIPFFTGTVNGGGGTQFLQFPYANIFGYYAFLGGGWMFHVDLGYESVTPDTNDTGVYFWDLASGHWFYTNSQQFPYLYDFTFNAWLYYFPDTTKPGHYTTNPRYFVNMTTGHIFTM
jgi:hypothetical protein